MFNMKTIEENNRMIAEFMAGRKVEVHHNQYNESWNELMPVVEKCLESHNSLIDGRGILDTPYHIVVSAMQEVSISELHKAVVQFIEWFNENK